jgi:hypothetical protein
MRAGRAMTMQADGLKIDMRGNTTITIISSSSSSSLEFAFYGPIGFDLGALVSNFLLAYFSQAGTVIIISIIAITIIIIIAITIIIIINTTITITIIVFIIIIIIINSYKWR